MRGCKLREQVSFVRDRIIFPIDMLLLSSIILSVERQKPQIIPEDIDYPVSRNGFVGIAAGLGIAAGTLVAHANEVKIPDENIDRIVKVAAGTAGLAVAVLVAGYEWSNRVERQWASTQAEQTPNESLLASFAEEGPTTA